MDMSKDLSLARTIIFAVNKWADTHDDWSLQEIIAALETVKLTMFCANWDECGDESVDEQSEPPEPPEPPEETT